MDPKELASQLRKPSGQQGIETGKAMNDGNKYMYALTYSLLNLIPGQSVLEIGFGNGKFIGELVKENQVYYHGIDFSQTMVQEAISANQKFIQENKVKIQQANLSSIPYPDNYFDRIFTINTLYFWDNPHKDIGELKRVLKPGGMLYLTIRPKETVQHLEFTKHGFTLYNLEDVCSLLDSAGLKNIEYSIQDEPEIDMQGNKIRLKGLCVFGKK